MNQETPKLESAGIGCLVALGGFFAVIGLLAVSLASFLGITSGDMPWRGFWVGIFLIAAGLLGIALAAFMVWHGQRATEQQRADRLAQVLSEHADVDSFFEAIKIKSADAAFMDLVQSANNEVCNEAVHKWYDWQDQEIAARLKEEATPYLAHVALASQKLAGPKRTHFEGPLSLDVVDLSSPEHRQIVADVVANKYIGPTFDSLVAEIVAIGREQQFVIATENPLCGSANYDKEHRHKRARRIGLICSQTGGMELMWAAYYRAKAAVNGRDLESCWDGIGAWQGRSKAASATPPRASVRTTAAQYGVVFALLIALVAGTLMIVWWKGYGGRRDRAAAQAAIDKLTRAVEAFKDTNGSYPFTLEDLSQFQPTGSPGFIAPELLIDPWGNSYQYNSHGPHHNGEKPDVWTEGPGGKIGNWKEK